MSTDYQRESINKNPIPYQVDKYEDKVTKKSKKVCKVSYRNGSLPLGTLGMSFLVQAKHASIILLVAQPSNLLSTMINGGKVS